MVLRDVAESGRVRTRETVRNRWWEPDLNRRPRAYETHFEVGGFLRRLAIIVISECYDAPECADVHQDAVKPCQNRVSEPLPW
jgi:hypothetical protein